VSQDPVPTRTVAIVTPYFAPKIGGLETYAYHVASGLSGQHGWRVVVVTSNHGGRGWIVEELDGLTVHRLPVWGVLSHTPVNPLWPLYVRRVLRRERPDVINAHTPVPLLSDVAAWVSGRIPVVLTYHASTLDKFQNPAFNVIVRLYSAVEQLTFQRSRVIIAVSGHVRDCLPARFRDRIEVVPNAVASTDIVDHRQPPEPYRVLFMASLDRSHSWKGLDHILAAVACYRNRFPEPIELIVAGDGDGRSGYQRRASQLGVADRVHFVGTVTGPDKIRELRAASALVSYPVTANDAFPTVLLEAWANRVPVVAAAIGAITSLVADGVDGLLVPPRRPELLAGTLRRLLTDRDLVLRLTEAGAERVAAGNTWERQVAATDRILTRVAGTGRTGIVAAAATRVAAPAAVRVSRLWRRLLTARSVELPSLPQRRLMVLAPHPDDETFGCGAVVARARASGVPVTVVAATDGRHSTTSTVFSPEQLAELRAGELRAACRALGVPDCDVLQLGFEDGALAGQLPALAHRLTELLRERRPEVLLVPCVQDEHPDHRAVHLAAVRAAGSLPRPPAVLAYPLWTWAHAPWFGAAGWRRRLPLLAWSLRQVAAGGWVRVASAEHLAAKRAALRAYASQTSNLTGEPSWSHLSAEFCALFLQPAEVFLPVSPRRASAR
jgi:LmbE family N-acetylglucosaminyl deacetylase/glycosyltransferase involved in cell wall biosynthesis